MNRSAVQRVGDGYMDSVNRDPRILLNFSSRLYVSEGRREFDPVITRLGDVLVRQEFIAVFRPEDVKALLFLRNCMNWRGHALIFMVPGGNQLARVTYNALRRHGFSVFCCLMINAGDVNPFGYTDGFGAHPVGYTMFINNILIPPNPFQAGHAHALDTVANFTDVHGLIEPPPLPPPPPETTAYQDGFIQASRHILSANYSIQMHPEGYEGYRQGWNDYRNGYNAGANQAAGGAALGYDFAHAYGAPAVWATGNPFGLPDNPHAFAGFAYEMPRAGGGLMNPHLQDPTHRDFCPYINHPAWRR